MYNMFTGLINDITKSQPTKTTTTAKPPMSSIPPTKQEIAEQELGFGHSGGSSPAYSGSSGVNPEADNPHGITGVYDKEADVGFYGSPEHFIYQPTAQSNAYDPYAALNELNEEKNYYQPEYTPANIEAATPFLDSYMRAKEAADRPGPVSSMFRDELS